MGEEAVVGRVNRSLNLGSYLLEHGSDNAAVETVAGDRYTRDDLRRVVATLAERFIDDRLTKSRVGLDLSPSFHAIATYLALLVAGNTVVIARRIDQPPWPGYLAAAGLDGLLRAVGGRVDGHLFDDRVDYDVAVLLDGTTADFSQFAAAPTPGAAVNLFTSGTTGRPKIVELSHEACIASSEAILEALPLDGDTRTALVLSLAHSFGMSVLHTHLRAGSSLYCVERPEFVGDVLRAFTAGGCNSFAGVPTQLRALATTLVKSPGSAPGLGLVMQAGGHLAPDEAEHLLAALSPECQLFQMYGQTEAAARITILDAEARSRVPASVGRPIAGSAVRILDETGAELPPNTEGEVVACGPTLMTGYYEDPTATAEVLRDGWLHTGDFGYLDPEGFLYVTGRRSNFVKIDGERISLEAVEHAAVSACPEIADALALPVCDDTGRGAIVVHLDVVLARPLDDADYADVVKRVRVAVRSNLGKKAEPRAIERVDQIPYTPNGKKMRPRIYLS